MRKELTSRGERADQIAAVVFSGMATVVVGLFLWVIAEIVGKGLDVVSWSFLSEAPELGGRAGGISSVLVSTAGIIGVCLTVAIPLGTATALFLSEWCRDRSRLGRIVRRSLDVLAGVPSIVFGLFGHLFFCRLLGMGYSLLAGGLTLACMILPIFIRSAEAGLRAVPNDYRIAAAALGLTRSAMIAQIILPAAIPGLVAGLVLGLGRAAAETAALLFTSGYVDRMPGSLLDSGRSLTVHIYDLSMNVPGGNKGAAGSALVLLVLLLCINSMAAFFSRVSERRHAASL